ncbi:MAG: hypothetical protein IIA45_11145 [Bacteroidetes bacterium]|nr:hypothetical protein [Bacteroidota bacterium]
MVLKKDNNLYEYLERTGVLQTGDEDLIQKARNEYYKLYQKEYKRNRRITHPEFSIHFAPDEHLTIAEAARKHNMSISRFIKDASLSYTKQVYLALDPVRIGRIEQSLSQIINEIRSLAESKDFWLDSQASLDKIYSIVNELEDKVSQELRRPVKLDNLINELLSKNPDLKEQLIKNINDYDNKEPDKKR